MCIYIYVYIYIYIIYIYGNIFKWSVQINGTSINSLYIMIQVLTMTYLKSWQLDRQVAHGNHRQNIMVEGKHHLLMACDKPLRIWLGHDYVHKDKFGIEQQTPWIHLVVSWNRDTPKSSMLVGFSLTKTNHFWDPPIDGNPHLTITIESSMAIRVKSLVAIVNLNI